jgi:hypothetical protein
VLQGIGAGRFPAQDGSVDVVPPWRDGMEALVSFTAHLVVATRVPSARLVSAGVDAYSGAFAAPVLAALAGDDGEVGGLDVLLMGVGTGRTLLPERRGVADNPRVMHARAWREGVHVHGDGRGLVTVAQGVAGLPELSFEVPADRPPGTGRALMSDARGLIAEGEPVLACVAPGNARSLRAALAAGFVPIGAVQLIKPGRRKLP